MPRLRGEASADIYAPIERCWEVVADVELAPEWQSGLDWLSALERDAGGRAIVCEAETDVKVTRVKSRVRFSYEPPSRLSWEQVRGQLKSVEGSWTLDALDGERTRATYTIEGDPGRVLWLLVRPLEGLLRELLVAARPKELKSFVEGP